MCLFQSSLFNKALETTELKQKRHNNQRHLARERRTGSQSFCTPKFAGASSGQLREWQSHVPKFGAEGTASSNEIHHLVTPRQKSSYGTILQPVKVEGWDCHILSQNVTSKWSSGSFLDLTEVNTVILWKRKSRSIDLNELFSSKIGRKKNLFFFFVHSPWVIQELLAHENWNFDGRWWRSRWLGTSCRLC